MNEGLHRHAQFERTKSNRLEDIVKLIDSAPLATAAEEAFTLVTNSFSEIEEKEKEPRMRVGFFKDLFSITLNNKKVYCQWYIGHILLIGENGSIELREKEGGFDKESFEKDREYINTFPVIFSKPGSDNKGIWF